MSVIKIVIAIGIATAVMLLVIPLFIIKSTKECQKLQRHHTHNVILQ